MQSGDDEVGNSRARSSSVDRQRISRQMLDVYTVEKDTNVRQINNRTYQCKNSCHGLGTSIRSLRITCKSNKIRIVLDVVYIIGCGKFMRPVII